MACSSLQALAMPGASAAQRRTDPVRCAHGRRGHHPARLPADNQVICTLRDPSVPGLAKEAGNTRSAVALELWRPHLEGSVVVIGNAPTALFYLLEMLDAGAPSRR